MKYISTLLLTIAVTQLCIAQNENFPVVHVHIDRVLNSMPELKEIQAELSEFQIQLNKQLNAKVLEYNNKLEYWNRNGQNLELDAKMHLKNELTSLSQNLSVYEKEIKTSFLQKQHDLFDPLRSKLLNIINKLAEANNYAYVLQLDENNSSGLLYAKGSLDIIEDVLQQIISGETQE